jgi:hypothetical protein
MKKMMQSMRKNTKVIIIITISAFVITSLIGLVGGIGNLIFGGK